MMDISGLLGTLGSIALRIYNKLDLLKKRQDHWHHDLSFLKSYLKSSDGHQAVHILLRREMPFRKKLHFSTVVEKCKSGFTFYILAEKCNFVPFYILHFTFSFLTDV